MAPEPSEILCYPNEVQGLLDHRPWVRQCRRCPVWFQTWNRLRVRCPPCQKIFTEESARRAVDKFRRRRQALKAAR